MSAPKTAPDPKTSRCPSCGGTGRPLRILTDALRRVLIEYRCDTCEKLWQQNAPVRAAGQSGKG